MAEGDPRPVREEDSFDVAAVATWLGTEVPEVRQFLGGASNLTYLLRYADRDLILRRPPTGHKAKSAHDMGREYRIQKALKPGFGLVPEMVGYCDDESVIGSPFYVMERLDGTILRRDLPSGMSLDPAQARALCENALDVLIALHRVSPDEAGLADLGRGPGYVARQVAGWSDRYRRARTDDVGDFEDVMGWLDARRPDDVGACLIHNDFRFDNLVLAPDDPLQVRGVLDWEMATVGDPLMDLGGMVAYWVQADDDEFLARFRRQPTNLPGMLTREQVVDYYCDATGFALTPEQWLFYEVFGLFRLGVIAQQIYYRLFHGQTHNEAYRIFHPAVRYLEQRSRGMIGLP